MNFSRNFNSKKSADTGRHAGFFRIPEASLQSRSPPGQIADVRADVSDDCGGGGRSAGVRELRLLRLAPRRGRASARGRIRRRLATQCYEIGMRIRERLAPQENRV